MDFKCRNRGGRLGNNSIDILHHKILHKNIGINYVELTVQSLHKM